MICESYSTEDTENLGIILANEAKKGDIFCLSGNLGAGKTVFTQGFAKGLGFEGSVTSPTFSLVNEYIGGRLPMYHFDLYRLENGKADLDSTGYEDYFFGEGVCLVEWAELAKDAIPPHAIWVHITPHSDTHPDHREIAINEDTSH